MSTANSDLRGELAAQQWTAAMLRGDFAAAWRESDSIRRSGLPDFHRLWDGMPLNGRRTILRCLHGLGDAVQFLRYAPRLSRLVGALSVEVPPEMVELAHLFSGVSYVVSWENVTQGKPPAWDSQIEIMELPYLFRTELRDLPIAENYLHIPSEYQKKIAFKMNRTQLPRVGLVWTAGEWNQARSVPFSLLMPLLLNENCEFWNLQGGDTADAWGELPYCERFQDARLCGNGLVALAATVEKMDLVITVDTLVAHLAGAMKRPTWLLLNDPPDWRWMTDCTWSPWYPSLRLFRQTAHGDWTCVVEAISAALARWLRDANNRRKAP